MHKEKTSNTTQHYYSIPIGNGNHGLCCDCFDCDVRYDRRVKETKASMVTGLALSTLQKRRWRGEEPFAEYDGRSRVYSARYLKAYCESRIRKSTSEPEAKVETIPLVLEGGVTGETLRTDTQAALSGHLSDIPAPSSKGRSR